MEVEEEGEWNEEDVALQRALCGGGEEGVAIGGKESDVDEADDAPLAERPVSAPAPAPAPVAVAVADACGAREPNRCRGAGVT